MSRLLRAKLFLRALCNSVASSLSPAPSCYADTEISTPARPVTPPHSPRQVQFSPPTETSFPSPSIVSLNHSRDHPCPRIFSAVSEKNSRLYPNRLLTGFSRSSPPGFKVSTPPRQQYPPPNLSPHLSEWPLRSNSWLGVQDL